MPARVDLRQRALFAPEPGAAARDAEDGVALETLRTMAGKLAAHFGLSCTSIDAEADGVVWHYGICTTDGRIRIRLRHARTGRLLKESSLVDTLCHELAHLRYFDHSVRFRRFHERVLAEARRRGWYRPGPTRTAPLPAAACEISR